MVACPAPSLTLWKLTSGDSTRLLILAKRQMSLDGTLTMLVISKVSVLLTLRMLVRWTATVRVKDLTSTLCFLIVCALIITTTERKCTITRWSSLATKRLPPW